MINHKCRKNVLFSLNTKNVCDSDKLKKKTLSTELVICKRFVKVLHNNELVRNLYFSGFTSNNKNVCDTFRSAP